MVLWIQVVLCLGMVVRVLPGLSAFMGVMSVYNKLKHWDLPAPRPWEYIWIVSLMAAFLGFKAIPKNASNLLKQYILGTIIFGVVPIVYGMVDQGDDLYAYLNEKKSKANILGYPSVIAWFMFLTLAIQLHLFGLYFSYKLLKSWSSKAIKNKKAN